jgi:hypothetical protein
MNVTPFLSKPKQRYRINVTADEYRTLRCALIKHAQNPAISIEENKEAARLQRLLTEAEIAVAAHSAGKRNR